MSQSSRPYLTPGYATQPGSIDRKQRALVVEGGAMRGIFAAGVLDYFIDQHYFEFDQSLGVSAGSTNLIGYLAGDRERSYRIITDHARRAEFMNLRRYLRGGHFCDVSWLWHASLDEIPLTIERFLERNIPLWVVTTSVSAGEPRYFPVRPDNMNQLFPASCAMPLVYRDFPPVDNEPMTDGGLTDSIPVRRAYAQGARDITVVLSQPAGYRKKPGRFPQLMKPFFAEHPELFSAVLNRTRQYNQALDFIAHPPADCQIRIIAPPPDFDVSRFTQDINTLDQGYEQGYSAAREYLARPTNSRSC